MRQLTQFVTITLIVAVVLSAGYYIFWLRPRLEAPRALIAAQTTLHHHRQSLAKSRLSFLELVRLSPAADLGQTHATILARLRDAYEQGQDVRQAELPYQLLSGAPTDTLRFTNQEFPDAFADIRSQHSQLLEIQQPVVESLTAAGEALAKVYSYNPSLDLAGLDPATQRERLTGRADAAKTGLQNILDALPDLTLPPQETTALAQELKASLQILDTLIAAANQNNSQALQAARTTFIEQFPQVQQAALTAEQALITNPAAVSMLTDLTNLLLVYDFWLDRIGQELQRI